MPRPLPVLADSLVRARPLPADAQLRLDPERRCRAPDGADPLRATLAEAGAGCSACCARCRGRPGGGRRRGPTSSAEFRSAFFRFVDDVELALRRGGEADPLPLRLAARPTATSGSIASGWRIRVFRRQRLRGRRAPVRVYELGREHLPAAAPARRSSPSSRTPATSSYLTPALAGLPDPDRPAARHAQGDADRLPAAPARPAGALALRDHRLGTPPPLRRRAAPGPLPPLGPRAHLRRAGSGGTLCRRPRALRRPRQGPWPTASWSPPTCARSSPIGARSSTSSSAAAPSGTGRCGSGRAELLGEDQPAGLAVVLRRDCILAEVKRLIDTPDQAIAAAVRLFEEVVQLEL